MIINGILGFAMMLTILFCIGDLDAVVGTNTGFPFIQVFYDSIGNLAGSTVMVVVIIALTWSCAIGITTTASRMTWSFARDRGTPFSHYLMKVDKRTKVPIIAVVVVTLLAALLTLIYIGSPTAFNGSSKLALIFPLFQEPIIAKAVRELGESCEALFINESPVSALRFLLRRKRVLIFL